MAAFVGIMVKEKLQGSFGAPLGSLVTIASVVITFILVNGVLFNGIIFKKVVDKNRPVLSCSEIEGSITYPGEPTKTFKWSDVEKIEIITTSDGPWNEDFWWLFYLEGNEVPIDIAQGVKGNEEIFNVLEKHFVGHDGKSVISALGSTSNARFLVWEFGNVA